MPFVIVSCDSLMLFQINYLCFLVFFFIRNTSACAVCWSKTVRVTLKKYKIIQCHDADGCVKMATLSSSVPAAAEQCLLSSQNRS